MNKSTLVNWLQIQEFLDYSLQHWNEVQRLINEFNVLLEHSGEGSLSHWHVLIQLFHLSAKYALYAHNTDNNLESTPNRLTILLHTWKKDIKTKIEEMLFDKKRKLSHLCFIRCLCYIINVRLIYRSCDILSSKSILVMYFAKLCRQTLHCTLFTDLVQYYNQGWYIKKDYVWLIIHLFSHVQYIC